VADAFNKADTETISNLYADNAVNHQVANEPIIGKKAIRQMFATEFAKCRNDLYSRKHF
jgi:ketosteroid isomerase-like protein